MAKITFFKSKTWIVPRDFQKKQETERKGKYMSAYVCVCLCVSVLNCSAVKKVKVREEHRVKAAHTVFPCICASQCECELGWFDLVLECVKRFSIH